MISNLYVVDCACNTTGSNSSVCDHVTGMCPCKPGVEGRQCDRCKVQHKDFSDIGCERELDFNIPSQKRASNNNLLTSANNLLQQADIRMCSHGLPQLFDDKSFASCQQTCSKLVFNTCFQNSAGLLQVLSASCNSSANHNLEQA